MPYRCSLANFNKESFFLSGGFLVEVPLGCLNSQYVFAVTYFHNQYNLRDQK